MPISFRRPAVAGPALALLLALLFAPATRAFAQDDQEAPRQLTPAERFLERFDLGLEGAAEMTSTVSGVEQRDANTTQNVLTIKPSRTVGELATLRYTVKPWMGFEFNFGNQRYTEDVSFVPEPTQGILLGGVQTNVHEMTWGYVAHPPHLIFSLQPFFGAGAGTMRFKPTAGGGQGLPYQYRMTYYYTVGVERQFPDSHFGMRAGFRQLIYLAPDYLQNYLTITRRVRTSEPNIGFFVRF
ncbi:MAG TPA: hypothetical protein VG714_01100 [Acidobacteriaceae bacterium]|nr:hypothetical protein [Acidobacteriaceae bacterium]